MEESIVTNYSAGSRSESRTILDKYFSVQFSLNGMGPTYLFKLRDISLNGICILVKEDSEGYKALKDFFSEQNIEGFEKFLLENQVEKFHFNAGFKEARFKLIGESIGEKNELDLLPYEGEWFSIGNVYSKKG